MINKKPSLGFYFLVLNFFVIALFSYWVATPMWYAEVKHNANFGTEFPHDEGWTEEFTEKYKQYLKSLDN